MSSLESITKIVSPAERPLNGRAVLPGDKSISHRYGMLASIADGVSVIHNYSSGADCHSTLGCMRSLGVEIAVEGNDIIVSGRGLLGLRAPSTQLDAGNSGSTIRMLSGILAGQQFTTRIAGDSSLAKRPMLRIMTPLEKMGARIKANGGQYPPLEIRGALLKSITYEMPVASAQVKSCVLLAGLYAAGKTTVVETTTTRDHTEVALREFGVPVESVGGRITVKGPAQLEARELTVPGDMSAAAFFLVAAAIVPGSVVTLPGVGVNPTRAALLDFLRLAGVQIDVLSVAMQNGEPVADLQVRGGVLRGGVIEKDVAAALIDEIPVLGILGAVSEEGLTVRDAAELRVKETDRIETLATNLRKMGVEIETAKDGFHIPGKQQFRAAEVSSFGDHRIAMAMAVAALRADAPVTIQDAGAASVSFPEFWSTLDALRS